MNPCKDCEKRFVRVNDEGKVERCDSTCEEYKTWKTLQNEHSEKRRKYLKDESLAYMYESTVRKKQSWNRKKRKYINKAGKRGG